MSSFKIFIKPTSGGEKFSVETQGSMQVSELKDAVTAAADIPAAEQRLIYKGQVLKNERTVESYGIQADHVLHVVRSKPPPQTDSSQRSQPAGQDATIPAQLFGAGAQPPSTGQQQMLSGILNMPQVQSMLQNPEVLRSMLNANPAIRQLMNSNPEMAHVFNNPQLLRESLNLAANPSLLREQMRHSDRAMSNLEAHPEGFNALRRMYENLHEPLQNAAQGENVSASNPFASLLQSQQQEGSTAGAQPAAVPAGGSGEGSAAPNTAPLPNPWEPNAGSTTASTGGGTGSGAAAPRSSPDLRELASMGMLGGLDGITGGANPLENPQARDAMLQLMANPAYRQAMNDFMASSQGQQVVRSIAQNNPQLREMLDRNPAFRDMFMEPERMRQLLSPDTMQAILGLRQNMDQLQRAIGGTAPGMLGEGMETGGAGTAGTGTADSSPAGPGAAGAPGAGMDLAALAALLGGGAGEPEAAPPVTNPEETYASQLSQLQEMGFYDREANVQALQRTGGNLQAAVDRLLNQPY